MWLHVVIFLITLGIVLIWKMGWLRLEGIADRKSMRLFLLVAVCGNVLGLVLTASGGADQVYSEGYQIKKETDGSYTAEFYVSVDGGDAEKLNIQVPEKESEEPVNVQEESSEISEEQKIREAVERYNQDKNDPDYYYLPESLDGKALVWKQPGDRSGTLLGALGLFAAFAVMLRNASEEQKKEAKRMEQLLMDYPSLVMKFTLLVQAGMTVRKAFKKTGADYERMHLKEKRFAYEEILTACHEMDSGIAEAEAYRRFGDRCGQMKYKTFSTLLIQNLQKGSRHMSEMLEKEAIEAWDERKRKAKVLGEAAATKLLFPMILMLLVVMAVIMIPAFLSFYQ